MNLDLVDLTIDLAGKGELTVTNFNSYALHLRVNQPLGLCLMNGDIADPRIGDQLGILDENASLETRDALHDSDSFATDKQLSNLLLTVPVEDAFKHHPFIQTQQVIPRKHHLMQNDLSNSQTPLRAHLQTPKGMAESLRPFSTRIDDNTTLDSEPRQRPIASRVAHDDELNDPLILKRSAVSANLKDDELGFNFNITKDPISTRKPEKGFSSDLDPNPDVYESTPRIQGLLPSVLNLV